MLFFEFYERKKSDVFMGGVFLGASIWLGNVQYTIMWYMVFAIIFTVLFFLGNEKKNCIVKFFSNVCIGLFISFPQIALNYRALKSSILVNVQEEFFDYGLSLSAMLVHGVFPDELLNMFTGAQLSEYWTIHFYFVGIFAVCFLICMLKVFKQNDKENIVVKAFLVCIIFFVMWSIGKAGIIACILHKLPVIQSLRHLQKKYYVIIPLLAVPTIYVCKRYSKQAKVLIYIGVLLAVLNISSINVGGVTPPEKCDLTTYGELDLSNYKVLAVLEKKDEGGNSKFQELVNDAFTVRKAAIRNYGAYYHIYTLGGYELSYTERQHKTVDGLMGTAVPFPEYNYANAANAEFFCMNEKTEEALRNNAVKYIITNSMAILLQINNFERIVDIGDGYSVIILKDVPPLIRSGSETLTFNNVGNALKIRSRKSGVVQVALPFNEKYKAYYRIDGKKYDVDIEPTINGFIELKNVPMETEFFLEYTDAMPKMCILFAGIFFMTVCVCTLFYMYKMIIRSEKRG